MYYFKKDGVYMANWNFTADSEIQRELADRLEDNAGNYEQKIAEMYKEIAGMGSHWVGEDYDQFKEGTEGYKNALQDLSDGIKMYAKHFRNMADGTDTLATKLIEVVENMTQSK